MKNLINSEQHFYKLVYILLNTAGNLTWQSPMQDIDNHNLGALTLSLCFHVKRCPLHFRFTEHQKQKYDNREMNLKSIKLAIDRVSRLWPGTQI